MIRVVSALGLAFVACGGHAAPAPGAVSNHSAPPTAADGDRVATPTPTAATRPTCAAGPRCRLAMARYLEAAMCRCASAACVDAVTLEEQQWDADSRADATQPTEAEVAVLAPLIEHRDRCALQYVEPDDDL